MKKGKLAGKVIIVTGAASGIGKAIYDAVAEYGAIGEGIDLHDGPGVCAADISTLDVVDAVAVIAERHGRVDGLINCAGICPSGTITTTPDEVWDRVFSVNVRGVFLTSKAVIPLMQASGGGAIVNIASNYGLVGGRNAVAYSASKGAVVSMTRAMALDYAPDRIRVNCICPGTIDTPMISVPMAGMTDEEIADVTVSRHARHPLGRIGKPEEVAPGAIYLLSDDASFVTGAVLAIDGGYTAQ